MRIWIILHCIDFEAVSQLCYCKEHLKSIVFDKLNHRRKYLKLCDRQGVNIHNIQTANSIKYQKKNQTNQKWTEDINRHFYKKDM